MVYVYIEVCMNSIFDIIGPIMIGPSSSHTAGAARLGKMARCIFRSTPKKVDLTLYGSFAKTYKGHGTDRAFFSLIHGQLGCSHHPLYNLISEKRGDGVFFY